MAELLGISRPVAYKLTQEEGFPVIRVGRRLLIPIDALQKWITNESRTS